MTAVGYTRLSQESDTSIERQKRHIRSYADEHGLTIDRIYDDGEKSSGFDSEREQFQALRRDINDGDIDAVVVNDKRRLARDVDDVMRLIPELRTNGVELHTHTDGQADLSDPMRAAIEILQAAAAHEEKMAEIEKAIESVNERLANGYDHGRPRFGMTYGEDGRYQVPGENFETVKEIWSLCDNGATYEEIEAETGVAGSTAERVVKSKQWYQERVAMADGRDTEK